MKKKKKKKVVEGESSEIVQKILENIERRKMQEDFLKPDGNEWFSTNFTDKL